MSGAYTKLAQKSLHIYLYLVNPKQRHYIGIGFHINFLHKYGLGITRIVEVVQWGLLGCVFFWRVAVLSNKNTFMITYKCSILNADRANTHPSSLFHIGCSYLQIPSYVLRTRSQGSPQKTSLLVHWRALSGKSPHLWKILCMILHQRFLLLMIAFLSIVDEQAYMPVSEIHLTMHKHCFLHNNYRTLPTYLYFTYYNIRRCATLWK